MATQGKAFFDAKSTYFKTADEATCSDLAAVLGKVREGESLAPGIAKTLFEKRAEIERIFAEHDAMTGCSDAKIGFPGYCRSSFAGSDILERYAPGIAQEMGTAG